MPEEDNTIDRKYVLNTIEYVLERLTSNECQKLIERGYSVGSLKKEIEVHEKIMAYIKENLK